MPSYEIERKFLLLDESWRLDVIEEIPMRQGYLNLEKTCSIRIRIAGSKATLSVKGATIGTTRLEFEYPVPLDHANAMLDHMAVAPLIEKTRYLVPMGPHTFEIDVFKGDNEGLVVAEIELSDPEETFMRPSWLGQEVTEDPRYYNTCLTRLPYCSWPPST